MVPSICKDRNLGDGSNVKNTVAGKTRRRVFAKDKANCLLGDICLYRDALVHSNCKGGVVEGVERATEPSNSTYLKDQAPELCE